MPDADFYSLPSLYDILHTPGTAAEIDGLQQIALRYAGPDAPADRWLEPACGTGRYLRTAWARGIDIVGYDLSEPMVAYANRSLQRRGLEPCAHTLDMTSACKPRGAVKPNSFGLAFCLINSVRHLMTDADIDAHLSNTAEALARGGVYAVGINFGGFKNGLPLEMPSEDQWSATRRPVSVHQLVQFEPPESPRSRTERVRSVLTKQTPASDSVQFVSHYDLRTYTRTQWHRAIDRSPLEHIGTVDEAGDEIEVGEAGYAIHLLRKP